MALISKDKGPSGKRIQENASGIARTGPGAADFLAGEAAGVPTNLRPYLPQELVGGVIPHIPGTEEEAVWNAASQACGTEKVHFCYSVEEKRYGIWPVRRLLWPQTRIAGAPWPPPCRAIASIGTAKPFIFMSRKV